MWCTIKKLIRSNSGAVAPTIALSLTALVATGGIAFDYARIANLDTDADYVLVTVSTRTANYALTPIVAAFSGDAVASAFATLDSAYCNLPPFMLCKPSADFDPAEHIGDGLRLVIGSSVAPGNFGFLQTGFGDGAENLAKAIGWNGSAGGCVGKGSAEHAL